MVRTPWIFIKTDTKANVKMLEWQLKGLSF